MALPVNIIRDCNSTRTFIDAPVFYKNTLDRKAVFLKLYLEHANR